MLGERERNDVGVDGIEEDATENEDGYDSLYWLPAREGEEVLGRRVLLGTVEAKANGFKGEGGRRRLRGKVWLFE